VADEQLVADIDQRDRAVVVNKEADRRTVGQERLDA